VTVCAQGMHLRFLLQGMIYVLASFKSYLRESVVVSQFAL
jgi:hypothetical protein